MTDLDVADSKSRFNILPGHENDSPVFNPMENPTRLVPVLRRGLQSSLASSSVTPGQVGVGIKFTQDEAGHHVITSLLPGGPAEKTGQIFVGDTILAVNDVTLSGKTSDEVIDLILGAPGSFVEILLKGSAAYGQVAGGDAGLTRGSRSQSSNGLVASPSSGMPLLKSTDSPVSKARGGRGLTPGNDEQQEFSTGTPASLSSYHVPKKAGIGAKFMVDSNAVVSVSEVMVGSPASESKRIHVGDRLLMVDGVDIRTKGPDEIASMLAGPLGSAVHLTIESAFDAEQRSVRLHRRGPSGNLIVSSPKTRSQGSVSPSSAPSASVHNAFSEMNNIVGEIFQQARKDKEQHEPAAEATESTARQVPNPYGGEASNGFHGQPSEERHPPYEDDTIATTGHILSSDVTEDLTTAVNSVELPSSPLQLQLTSEEDMNRADESADMRGESATITADAVAAGDATQSSGELATREAAAQVAPSLVQGANSNAGSATGAGGEAREGAYEDVAHADQRASAPQAAEKLLSIDACMTPKQSQRSPMTESTSPPAQIVSLSNPWKEGSQASQSVDSTKLDEVLERQKKQQENVDVVLKRVLELELHINKNHLSVQENLKNQGKVLNAHTDQIQRLSQAQKKSCCVIS